MMRRLHCGSIPTFRFVSSSAIFFGGASSSSSLRFTCNDDFFTWRNKEYASPFEQPCPYDCIVLYNASNHANNVAVEEIQKPWPDVRIVQTVVEGRTPVVGASHQIFIPKGTWGNMEVFEKLYSEYVVKNRFMKSIKVGFYPVWSSIAEDADVARRVQKMGFSWIGANPKAMDGLGKIEYKQFCKGNDLNTADFLTLSPPEEECASMDEEAGVKFMVDAYLSKVKGTKLEGTDCFVKSEYGGGGRGTVKSKCDRDSIEAAIRRCVNETKKISGIYCEQALDLSGATMFQIEMEVDAGEVVEGGRLVYFNKRNQKMVELGFSSAEITKFLPADIFQRCVDATRIIACESKYDGRGTNEILIVRFPDGKWDIFCSEFNKRVQVEHKALSYLFRYKTGGQVFNTIADQIMRSAKYRPPNYIDDLDSSGGRAVAHVRFIAPTINTTTHEVVFPTGVDVEGVILPKNYPALVHVGKLYADTDAQFGSALIIARSWEKLLDSLKIFARDTVVIGKNVTRDYFHFLQKFFDDKRIADLSLGCNQTFDVLTSSPNKRDGRSAAVVNYLQHSVSRVIVNGYKPDGGVKNRHYPTEDQLQKAVDLRNELLMMPACKNTAFLSYLDHHDEDRYHQELRETLRRRGGGMVSVFPRDVQQESSGSESHMIGLYSRYLHERLAADCGYVGYETGGAQYQTAEMSLLNSSKVQNQGMLRNLATYSLTRSHWMNALERHTPDEIRYVMASLADGIRSEFHIDEGVKGALPYFPYNFHAGNVVEQDEVTGLMLESGVTPIPNFVWDPLFSLDHYEQWLKRQFKLWKDHGRTLHHIRIKNAGQQREWTPENIWKYIALTRSLYKQEYGSAASDPIIHLHNHNFNGMASHVGFGILKKCQDEGFQHLIVDTAPPLMTHNNNLVVADALKMDKEEREKLHVFNEGAHTIWQLTERFRDYPQVRISPFSTWAGGTGSSDLAAADKVGIPRNEIEDAKVLGAKLSGLRGIVTPYSQWSMVIGYTCYKQGFKTFESVKAHIENGGTLELPQNIIVGLDKYQTLLTKPPLVAKLIENFKAKDPSIFAEKKDEVKKVFSEDAVRDKILAVAPNYPVTRQAIARVISYGDFALKAIKAEAEGEDHNWLLRYPELAYARKIKPGITFAVKGVPVTYAGIEDVGEDSADSVVTFKFEGQWLRVQQTDKKKASKITNLFEHATPTADLKNPNHVAAFMPGLVEEVFVSSGHTIKEGDKLYSVNSMKMVTTVTASAAHIGKTVDKIYAFKGEELLFGTQGVAPLVMTLH